MAKVTWDTKQVMANFNKLKASIDKKAEQACFVGAASIMLESEKICPFDTGNLKDSGNIEKLGTEIGYKFGYGMRYPVVYARRLHEHPEYKFKNGRKGKYLESPIKENTGDWHSKVRNKLKEALI
jgi:hypothetical protein